jgi:hypothetical protein
MHLLLAISRSSGEETAIAKTGAPRGELVAKAVIWAKKLADFDDLPDEAPKSADAARATMAGHRAM